MQESYPCPSPGIAFGRADPAPCLDSTAELTLVVGVQVSQLEGENVGELGLPLVIPDLPPHHHLWESGELALES